MENGIMAATKALHCSIWAKSEKCPKIWISTRGGRSKAGSFQNVQKSSNSALLVQSFFLSLRKWVNHNISFQCHSLIYHNILPGAKGLNRTITSGFALRTTFGPSASRVVISTVTLYRPTIASGGILTCKLIFFPSSFSSEIMQVHLLPRRESPTGTRNNVPLVAVGFSPEEVNLLRSHRKQLWFRHTTGTIYFSLKRWN